MNAKSALIGGTLAALVLTGCSAARPAARSTSLPQVALHTFVDPRHRSDGLKFTTCDLVSSRSEVLASGTFSKPFPDSGARLDVFLFNPTHPGVGGSLPHQPYPVKGSVTWEMTMHLHKGPEPTLCEVAVYLPHSR
jgi:hypothetical protein